MKKTALLVALSLTAIACDSDPAEGDDNALGEVPLSDSTDASGKADELNGRYVDPRFTEIVDYTEAKSGTASVVFEGEFSISVESPMVKLPAVDGSLEVTIAARDESTLMRFFLVAETDDGYNLVLVDGPGEFEDGDEPEGGEAQEVPVQVSYFQEVSVDVEANTITIASEDAGGQTTSDLRIDAANSTFHVLAVPIDTGVGNGWLGEYGYTFEARCDGAECGEEPTEPDAPVDDYAEARDVNARAVRIGGPAIAYTGASVGGGFSLGGTEFWYNDENGQRQKTFSYSQGSEDGRKCMLASAIRFEAIMSDPPPAMVELQEETNWSGRFFNWNEDKTGFDGAQLWAWRTGLIKWISGTADDGTCYLPTLEMVERAAASCLAQGAEIQGCRG